MPKTEISNIILKIPFASADVGINNELFLQSIINNHQIQVLFAKDHHKSDVINKFLTGDALNINLKNIKFKTAFHVTSALSRIDVILDVTLDELYAVFINISITFLPNSICHI